jgi:hypothetical protein
LFRDLAPTLPNGEGEALVAQFERELARLRGGLSAAAALARPEAARSNSRKLRRRPGIAPWSVVRVTFPKDDSAPNAPYVVVLRPLNH